MVSLLTLHILSFYVASARIFHWQLTIIISLFHLFRGKKRNVLRNRIDSCDYDLDQLLLGTILFTLLFFLLPTVFVFYLTFASARIAVIGLKAGLEIGLACLNHFPLFAVMLRIKDSRRLPGNFVDILTASQKLTFHLTGGICFELQDMSAVASHSRDASQSAPTSFILLKVLSLPFALVLGSPSLSQSPSLCAQFSSPTLSSATDYGNTTSPPEFFSAWSQASLYRPFIDRTCTACNTACFLQKELA